MVRPVVLDQLGRRGIPDIVEQEHQATVDILELVPVVTLVTAVTRGHLVIQGIVESPVTVDSLESPDTVASLARVDTAVTQAILEFLGTPVTVAIQAPPVTAATQDRVDIADTVGHLATAATPVRVDIVATPELLATAATQDRADTQDTAEVVFLVTAATLEPHPLQVTAATLASLVTVVILE